MVVLAFGIGMWLAAASLAYGIFLLFAKVEAYWLLKGLLALVAAGGAIYLVLTGAFEILVFVQCKLWDPSTHIPCV